MIAKPSGARRRTYFVQGHSVATTQHLHGERSFACDCAEYVRSQARGDAWCIHAQRVAAAASIDRLLQGEGLLEDLLLAR